MAFRYLLFLVFPAISIIVASCSCLPRMASLCPQYISALDSEIPGPIRLVRSNRTDCTPEEICEAANYNYNCLLRFEELDLDTKAKLMRNIAIYDDCRFQCMRFLCWMNERNACIRRSLILQWLIVGRMKDQVPSRDKLTELIMPLFGICDEKEKESVRGEIREAYIRSYIYDLLPWSRWGYFPGKPNPWSDYCGIDILIDPEEPMGLKIFSSDKTTVFNSIFVCWERNGAMDKGMDGESEVYCTCSNAVLGAIMVMKASLTSPQSLNQ